jgi:hypothetical protein
VGDGRTDHKSVFSFAGILGRRQVQVNTQLG